MKPFSHLDLSRLSPKLTAAIEKHNKGETAAALDACYLGELERDPDSRLVAAAINIDCGKIIEAMGFLGNEILVNNGSSAAHAVLAQIEAEAPTQNLPTCAIVGADGTDWCVTINLILFYRSLGFQVAVSPQVIPADLIVVTRFNESFPLDWSRITSKTPVHVYSYVGWNVQPFLNQLHQFPVHLWAASQELAEGSSCHGLTVGPLPVHTQFWTAPLGEIKFPLSHIGNVKEGDTSSWGTQRHLIEALHRPDAHVWGNSAWENIPGVKNYHGSLPIIGVPDIYRHTRFALGLRYPYQVATRTYSSRFWQAPLNGAALLSEPDSPAFPGIIQSGMEHVADSEQRYVIDRATLQREARKFWSRHWENSLVTVKQWLSAAPAGTSCNVPTGYTAQPFLYSALMNGLLSDTIVYR